MALNWLWSEKVGEADIQQRGVEFTCSLYQGNAYLIFLYEWEDEGQQLYQMHCFWADKDHMKNMLGLNPKNGFAVNEFNLESERLVAIRINRKMRYTKEIVTALVQAFDNLKIELVGDAYIPEEDI